MSKLSTVWLRPNPAKKKKRKAGRKKKRAKRVRQVKWIIAFLIDRAGKANWNYASNMFGTGITARESAATKYGTEKEAIKASAYWVGRSPPGAKVMSILPVVV
jgi:hypothetical protein